MALDYVSANVMHTINKKLSWFQRLERLYPHGTLLYLGMIGSGLIFLFMAIAFLFLGPNLLAVTPYA